MKIALRLVLLAALAALGVWLWMILFPSPEKVIRQRFAALARAASSSADESDLMRLAAGQNVAGFFSTNVELKVEIPNFNDHSSVEREEIAQAVVIGRSRSGGLKVTFPDVNVAVNPDKLSAVADVTVDADVRGEHDSFLQEMKFTLHKVDGQWLIIRVETVRVLS